MNLSDYRNAAKKALSVRKKASIPLNCAFCIFDLSEKFGVEVKFSDIKSFDGAFFKKSKTILVSTYRPEVRIRFTCAHELGHYFFEHGDHFDELVEKVDSPEGRYEERLCDAFASFLLMPKTTVFHGFNNIKVKVNDAHSVDFFKISNWLGVGYTTIIKHLRFGLNAIDHNHYNRVIKVPLDEIKYEFTGLKLPGNLIVVDKNWIERPIDLQCGDFLLIDGKGRVEGNFSKVESSKKNLWLAEKTGLCRLKMESPDKSLIVRVRRKEYVGRAIFRNLEEE